MATSNRRGVGIWALGDGSGTSFGEPKPDRPQLSFEDEHER